MCISSFYSNIASSHLKAAMTLFSIAVVLVSCRASYSNNIGVPDENQVNIVAGPGELSFSERYRLEITLPLPEREFIALLRRLQLPYEVCGDLASNLPLPQPMHRSRASLSIATKCYHIYGPVDTVRHVGERYRAFVDDAGNVIYIENVFTYTG